MRKLNRSYVVLLLMGVLVVPSMAFGGQSAGTTSPTLASIAAEHASKRRADRQRILNVLDRQELRKVAKAAGLRPDNAAVAVAALDGSELAQVLEQARHVNDALAGGQRPWWKPSTADLRTAIIIVIPMVLLLWWLGEGHKR